MDTLFTRQDPLKTINEAHDLEWANILRRGDNMNTIPEFNEADQGTQAGMFGTDKEIIIKGRGKVTQISMDDVLKLENIKEIGNGTVVSNSGLVR